MEESLDRCPVCGGRDFTFGYGFACGPGIGGYRICLDCDEVVDKESRVSGDCLNGIAERLGEEIG